MKRLIIIPFLCLLLAVPAYARDSRVHTPPPLFTLDASGNIVPVDSSRSLNMGATDQQTKISKTGVTLPQRPGSSSPALAFGDGDTGLNENSDDALTFYHAGNVTWGINADYITAGIGGGAYIKRAGASYTNPTLVPNASDLDTGIGANNSFPDRLSLIVGGQEGLRIWETNNKVVIGVSAIAVSDGNATIEFGTGATPTATPSPGFCALVVGDPGSGVTEMFAFDTAGNFTQMSAHNPVTGEAYHYSFNIYTGKTAVINHETGVKTAYIDASKKLNPEITYKDLWIKDYIAANTVNYTDVDGQPQTIVPTLAEAQTAAETGYNFNWGRMPPYVRVAWGK